MHCVKAILTYAFVGLSLTTGVDGAVASPREYPQLCADFSDAAKANCQTSFDLLTKEQNDVPEYKVFARGKGLGWTFRYDAANGTCIESAQLRLPHDRPLRLVYTSTDYEAKDGLPTLRIDALGIDVTAIPGRVADIEIKAPKEGTLDAKAGLEADSGENTSGPSSDQIVPAEVISEDAFAAWMKENGRENCED